MAEKSDLDTRFCVVWNTHLFDRDSKSSKFGLLDYTWFFRMERCKIFLTNDTERDFPKRVFRVTTFVEYLNCPLFPLSKCINSMVKHGCECIWDISDAYISKSFMSFGSSEVRVVCVFQDVPATAVSCKNETITLSTQTDFDYPLSTTRCSSNLAKGKFTSDKYVQASLDFTPDLESLSLDLRNLLDNKAIPDMKLRCGDRTICAHKAVLAARSEVFAAMFRNKMLESETGMVDITDLDAPVLELFLKYVYSGKMSSVSDDVVPSLYAAGDKYAVHALQKACSERMIADLSEENYLRFLTMADVHSDQDLKDAAVNFVVEHMELLRSQAWSKFKEEHPRLANHVMTIFIHNKHFN